MKVLVACEFSGIVRDAFRVEGHDAVSCDILASEREGPHLMCDVREVLDRGWDLMVCHPPCKYLAVCGARWVFERNLWDEQHDALKFVMELLDAPIKHICLENPVGVISTYVRKPNQYIQPWQFGHGETKKTGLWLKNLPLLKPTNIVEGREARIHKMRPGPNRGHERSRTYPGIAEAMAKQWGNLNG